MSVALRATQILVAGPSPNINLELFQCIHRPTRPRRVKVRLDSMRRPLANTTAVALHLNRRLWPFTALNSVLTQLWCICGTCGTLACVTSIVAPCARHSRQRHYDDSYATPDRWCC